MLDRLKRVDVADRTWLPVPGYEGVYEVSDQGDIRRISATKAHPAGHILSHTKVRGYHKVLLYREGVGRQAYVHRVVLSAFRGEPLAGHIARHLDDNQEHNYLANLAWGTPTENQLDLVRNGNHSESRKTHCPKNHPYDAGNTVVYPSRPNRRVCRECNAARKRRPLHYSTPLTTTF